METYKIFLYSGMVPKTTEGTEKKRLFLTLCSNTTIQDIFPNMQSHCLN